MCIHSVVQSVCAWELYGSKLFLRVSAETNAWRNTVKTWQIPHSAELYKYSSTR